MQKFAINQAVEAAEEISIPGGFATKIKVGTRGTVSYVFNGGAYAVWFGALYRMCQSCQLREVAYEPKVGDRVQLHDGGGGDKLVGEVLTLVSASHACCLWDAYQPTNQGWGDAAFESIEAVANLRPYPHPLLQAPVHPAPAQALSATAGTSVQFEAAAIELVPAEGPAFDREAFYAAAAQALIATAAAKRRFTADDVWRALPEAHRAAPAKYMGAFMSLATKRSTNGGLGLTVPTNAVRKSKRTRGPLRVWRSLGYGAKPAPAVQG